MTVKCIKSCFWGIHHAWGPEFQIEPGMILGDEFPKGTNAKDWADFKVKLIDAGHAVIVPDEKPADDEADADETENTGDADNGSDASEGDADGNTDETDTADATGDAEVENTDSTVDDSAEVIPETLKDELEGYVLKGMEDPMGNEQKIKAMLEALAKERYSFDVDKRMSVDNIIQAIVEAAVKK